MTRWLSFPREMRGTRHPRELGKCRDADGRSRIAGAAILNTATECRNLLQFLHTTGNEHRVSGIRILQHKTNHPERHSGIAAEVTQTRQAT